MKAQIFNIPSDPFQLVPQELRHLIPGFLERREKDVTELMQMLEKNDFGGIQDIAHKLKGSGTGYGFQLITDIGHEMELAAQENDAATLKQYIQQLMVITKT